jgi:toxin-antitoxin system PIN domain toxin
MTSIDSSILLYSYSEASPFHAPAKRFIEGLLAREDVALSELVLVEFYTLLRNPAVLEQPLSATEAVGVIQTYRHHPYWMVLGFDPDGVGLHDELWRLAAHGQFARRRIYDARLGLSLSRQGVTDFATANVKDFQGLGFQRIWNPLTEDPGDPRPSEGMGR